MQGHAAAVPDGRRGYRLLGTRAWSGTKTPRLHQLSRMADWRVWYFRGALWCSILLFTLASEKVLARRITPASCRGQATAGRRGDGQGTPHDLSFLQYSGGAGARSSRVVSCAQTIADYAFRSIGIGERLLPRDGFHALPAIHADRLAA